MALDYSTLFNNIDSNAVDLDTARDTSSYNSIIQWLSQLYLLKGVPFQYLVPHPEMLPMESIKYFNVDENWLTALIDGAFSIGRSISSTSPNLSEWLETQLYSDVTNDIKATAKIYYSSKTNQTLPSVALGNITGFILRSQAVLDFKNMEIVGYEKSNIPTLPDAAGTPMTILRLERLTNDVMIGLFMGTLYQLDFKEPSEGLHFGFKSDSVTYQGNNVSSFTKILRQITGDLAGKDLVDTEIDATDNSGIFRDTSTITGNYQPQGGVINMYALSQAMYKTLGDKVPYNASVNPLISDTDPAKYMTSLTSADFAMQFTVGTSKVSFIFTPPPS